MKRILLSILAFSFIFLSYSQGIKRLPLCTEIIPVKVKRNDTIIVSCDTAYILNRPTFLLYDNTYNKFKRNGANVKELMSSYEALIKIQEERIQKQTEEYNELVSLFKGTNELTLKKVDSSTATLDSVSTNLRLASKNIEETKTLINSAMENIRKEERDRWKRDLKWGIGGFAVGLTTGVILFAIID